MKMSFSPQRQNTPLQLERHGDRLTLNGDTFDFTPLPDGAELPAEAIESRWFAGPVRRENGVLNFVLVLPHGPQAPQEALFPAPLTLTEDGPVALPSYEMEPDHAED